MISWLRCHAIFWNMGSGTLFDSIKLLIVFDKIWKSASIYQTFQCSETNIALGMCDKVWQCLLSKKVSRELEEAVDIGLTCFWFLYYIATSLLQLRKTNKGQEKLLSYDTGLEYIFRFLQNLDLLQNSDKRILYPVCRFQIPIPSRLQLWELRRRS